MKVSESIRVEVKNFESIAVSELYQLLRLRAKVFVVEQDCVYQDLDNKDQKALHIMIKNHDDIVAYSRIFRAGNYFEQASIGRVVVAEEYRKSGLGQLLMKRSIEEIEQNYGPGSIKVSAQCYLKKFYGNLGFQPIGDEYLEDGIPHISMIKE